MPSATITPTAEATFSFGDFLTFMDWALTDASIGTQTPSSFTITGTDPGGNPVVVTVNGTGFTYDFFGPSGGTIENVEVSVGGVVQGNISTSIDVAELRSVIEAEVMGTNTAIENYFLGFDWTYFGTGASDIAPSTIGDGVTFNLRGNDSIYGNGGNDVIDGGDGNDLINGGAGNDTMTGGAGNDIFVVGSTGDQTIEAADGGTDTVRSYVHWTLGNNIERLELQGSANLNGTGNALNNTLVGNAGNNLLNGGAGNDYMAGGLGNDIYVVGAAGDRTIEAVNGGTDTVRSYVHWTLANNVERLELLGSGNLNGTGNALNNTLIGNSGNNLLNGGGGNDWMVGGAGNDIFVVGSAGDRTIEAVNGGTDTVRASVSWTLAANVERLELQGSGNINGTGNAANNTLIGNSGNNTLNGGAGRDYLAGGAGDDSFLFNTALNAATNVDTISGFSVADDRIVLENAIFSGLAAGALAAGAFHVGAGAAAADDRIIYNSTNGALYFDADGSGGTASIRFATLSPGLALTADHFLVV